MPRDDHNLPDDLALLGEELAASAAHLASVYPAPPFPSDRMAVVAAQVSRSEKKPHWRSWALAVAGLACAVAVICALPYLRGGDRNAAHRAPQVAVKMPHVDVGAAAIETQNGETLVPVLPVMQQAVEVPAAVFHDLSAPELEGMLDLLEQQPPAATRLSI